MNGKCFSRIYEPKRVKETDEANTKKWRYREKRSNEEVRWKQTARQKKMTASKNSTETSYKSLSMRCVHLFSAQMLIVLNRKLLRHKTHQLFRFMYTYHFVILSFCFYYPKAKFHSHNTIWLDFKWIVKQLLGTVRSWAWTHSLMLYLS